MFLEECCNTTKTTYSYKLGHSSASFGEGTTMLKGHEKGKPFTLSNIENEQLLLVNSEGTLKTYPYKQEKKAIVA